MKRRRRSSGTSSPSVGWSAVARGATSGPHVKRGLKLQFCNEHHEHPKNRQNCHLTWQSCSFFAAFAIFLAGLMFDS